MYFIHLKYIHFLISCKHSSGTMLHVLYKLSCVKNHMVYFNTQITLLISINNFILIANCKVLSSFFSYSFPLLLYVSISKRDLYLFFQALFSLHPLQLVLMFMTLVSSLKFLLPPPLPSPPLSLQQSIPSHLHTN